MEVSNLFHMNEGSGKTSYAQNSLFQKRVLEAVKPITEEAVMKMLASTHYPNMLGMVDLGCSSGPNTFSALTTITRVASDAYRKLSKPLPEFQLFLNDLPGNDFNSVFKALHSFYESLKEEGGGEVFKYCFMAGVPGSFFDRLFPANTLHFVHSSYSVHWLSQVPQGLYEEGGEALNKGNVYISETSPPGVRKAYLQQFQKDFSQFLKWRSHEVAPNGRMVLTYIGQRASENFEKDCEYVWLAFVRAIKNLISQGLVEEEKLDSFDLPIYTPIKEEVEEVVTREASFTIERFEELSVPTPTKISGKDKALGIRAVFEPITKHHFGEELMDKLFEECAQLIETELLNEMTKAKAVQGPITYVLVLKRSM
ncbi:hypothetical protein AMTR_s00058p00202720 [Amborella trichopoda]|uniref:Uncharacterized protein n=1 Tax=Amborella trichopoda TaxID=13333 RepID=W1PGE4_AMBTC|nr:hypothetical protein AMTR_s00058p00202720 [Amborella trichopoda]